MVSGRSGSPSSSGPLVSDGAAGADGRAAGLTGRLERRCRLGHGAGFGIDSGKLENCSQIGGLDGRRQLDVGANLFGEREVLNRRRLVLEANPVNRTEVDIGARRHLVVFQAGLFGFLERFVKKGLGGLEVLGLVGKDGLLVQIDDLGARLVCIGGMNQAG